MARSCFWIAMLLMVALTGCDKGTPSGVSGIVTFDGKPIETGNIRFDPLGDTPGHGASTKIVDGAYAIPPGQGLYAGNYMVAVSATRSTGRQLPGEGLPGEAIEVDEILQFIPEEFNGRTSLRRSLEGGGNAHDLHLVAPK